MRIRTGAVSVGVAVLALSAALTTPAAAVGRVPVRSVTLTNRAISFLGGTTMHAGRVIFVVRAPSGDHALQLLKLKRGYTPRQAIADVNAAFSGSIPAIRRVDANIKWLGGAEATPGHPGMFAETLYAGTYYAVDQGGNAMTTLHVFGTPPPRAWVDQRSTITTTMANRFATTSAIPHAGWTLFRNRSDEPHFLVLQHVKASTTPNAVAGFFASGSQSTPSWALPESTSSGTVSAGSQILFHYNLPAGKYLIMCFWPDDETGMPHAVMGMWKLVNLT